MFGCYRVCVFLWILLLLGAFASCKDGKTHTTSQSTLYVLIGNDLPVGVQSRLPYLLNKACGSELNIIVEQGNAISVLRILENEPTYMLLFGNTSLSSSLQQQVSDLGSEAYLIDTLTVDLYGIANITAIGAVGNPQEDDIAQLDTNIGAAYGSYALLEALGFAFFHPLAPVIPECSAVISRLSSPTNISAFSAPYWPIRGWHIHTEHLLELTNFLNGFGAVGPNFTTDYSSWLEMLPEWESTCEWLVANRQNRIEWLLLWAADWNDYAWSSERQQRLRNITATAHAFGLAAGVDVPLAEQQQHAWYMVTSPTAPFAEQQRQIEQHIDWLFAPDGATFDFLSTESGFSEFTHPQDTLMLAWMNVSAEYISAKYGRKAYIKCHCSTGQTAPNYVDPRTGRPLNFNFLPIYATPEMGIYPHTVQFYRFDDPTALSYGNLNFTYMLDFLIWQAAVAQREVVYHPETAYWVNFDINVPLLLPVYADSRLYDLRTIAFTEKNSVKSSFRGQVVFDSGWEWGYWLNDVLTARAAWDPLVDTVDTQDAAFKTLLAEVTAVFGEYAADSAQKLLLQLVEAERALLIYGGLSPDVSDIDERLFQRNGQAYVEGWDSWVTIGCLVDIHACTQPVRVGLEEVRVPNGVSYENTIAPLLQSMANNFSEIAEAMNELTVHIAPPALPLWNDLADAATMTALRAQLLVYLYEYAVTWLEGNTTQRQTLLKAALRVIQFAENVVARRESQYRVPLERIAGWGPNPTAYMYGYLWTVHSLYFYWRDLAQAEDTSLFAISPCYMNIDNPADIAFGEGILLNVTEALEQLLEREGTWWAELVAPCLAAPATEPTYPLSSPPSPTQHIQSKQRVRHRPIRIGEAP